jgi:hypothetical protein
MEKEIIDLIAERNVILSEVSGPQYPAFFELLSKTKLDIWPDPIMRVVSQKSDNLQLPIEQAPSHCRCC